MEKYKFLEHTADIKFQAFGKNLEECFENSVYALVRIICKNRVNRKIIKNIKVAGRDLNSLLYNFLEEMLYLIDSEDFLLSRVESIKINSSRGKGKTESYELSAKISGDNIKDYKTEGDVKAITYNEMFTKKAEDNKFICQVVVDV